IARKIRALATRDGEEVSEIIDRTPEDVLARLIHLTGVVALADEAAEGTFRTFDDRPEAPSAIFERPLARAEAIRTELMAGLASPLRGPHSAPAERALHAHLMEAKFFEDARKAE